MSQAQAELVARATDPHAELTTLHTLAQNYPGLRPYIAENPRTYPALLEWLGSLGDPAVDAALARRAAGAVGTAGPVGPVSAAEAGGEATTQMLPTGAGAAVSPTQATVALPVQQPSAPQQTQAYPPHQPYAAYQGAQAPGQYRPGGPGPQGTAAAAMGTTGAAVATGPLGAPAWAQRPAQGEQGVFGVGQAEEEPAGHGGTVWLWVLGAVALVLVVALTVWFLMGGADRPAAPSPEAVPTQAAEAPTETEQPGQPEQAAPSPSPTPSATPSPTPTPTALAHPAPAGAITLSSFASPSGNISCAVGADAVTCTIAEHEFVDNTCGEDNSLPFTIVLEANGSATGSCDLPAVGGAGATLSYGSAAQNGQMACTSSEEGVECWSQVTGEGFTVNRSGAYSTTR